MATAAPEPESCGLCKFYLGGECHLNPPSMWLPATNYLDAQADSVTRIQALWPRVAESAWCGHFLRNVQLQPA